MSNKLTKDDMAVIMEHGIHPKEVAMQKIEAYKKYIIQILKEAISEVENFDGSEDAYNKAKKICFRNGYYVFINFGYGNKEDTEHRMFMHALYDLQKLYNYVRESTDDGTEDADEKEDVDEKEEIVCKNTLEHHIAGEGWYVEE